MIIPSIDLMSGNAVQLIGGETKALDAGDPLPLARKFSLVGEIAVIDLDAALRQGENRQVIQKLLDAAPCRVGGGIRDVQTAIDWLDAGARKVILGTAARPEILRELPSDRVIAALDARDGEVVVDGWRSRTGRSIEDRMAELRPYASGFLVTLVENEGRMTGIDPDRISRIIESAAGAKVTIAGGVKSAEDIAVIDQLGADAQVGMALYTGAFELSDALVSCLNTDRPDGLFPTVVCDERGEALGLCYSNRDSIRAAIESGTGVYWSRARNALWRKGSTSGNEQELIAVDADCDRDALRFTVRQKGSGFCHTGTRTCFGSGSGLGELFRRLQAIDPQADSGSYTAKLFSQPELLGNKLTEEARELAETGTAIEAVEEAADLFYFAAVKLVGAGATIGDIERVLDRRAMKVTRRSQDPSEKSFQELRCGGNEQ
ncbi:MAG: phosphoribosyl-ATP diphosphatase [Phycisphaerales bacterium JB065]